MKIIVHGSLAFDYIKDYPAQFSDAILPDNIHNLNISFQITKITEKRGGCGGNISYNLSLLGMEAAVVCSVGSDAIPYVEFLQEQGIDMRYITVHDGARTSNADIITDRANNQMTAFYVGASGLPSGFHIKDTPRPKEAMMVFSPANNIADTMRLIGEAKELGVPYMFDPGQTIPDFTAEQLREAIEGAHIVAMNDYEHTLIKKMTGLDDETIREQVEYVVVTAGKQGSRIWNNGQQYEIPVCKEFDLVDPTGAGDAYRAGLIAAFSQEASVEDAGRVAATAAAYAISQHGTQEHRYTMYEFREVFEKHFGKSCPI